MRVKRKKGLTIIELLIVIAIIGLLTTFVAFVAPTQLRKARDARRKADLQKIKIAFYDYFFDTDCFPEELPGCGEDFGSSGQSYLKDFPCDLNDEPYVYAITKKGGGKCSQWFQLFTNLENTPDSIIDKIHCRQGCGPDKNDCNYNYGVASTNVQIYQSCSFAYVCSPGGACESFEDPWRSNCPITFGDGACEGLCDDPANRCENSSGKQIPGE